MESWYRQHGYAPFNMFALPRGLKKSLWCFSCRLRATTNRIPQYSRWEWYDEHDIQAWILHHLHQSTKSSYWTKEQHPNHITLACAIILDGYETLEKFCVEAIDTWCHASNRAIARQTNPHSAWDCDTKLLQPNATWEGSTGGRRGSECYAWTVRAWWERIKRYRRVINQIKSKEYWVLSVHGFTCQ